MPGRGPAAARDGGPWGLLLAAGASRRLGRPKQLVELDGEPLVRRAGARLVACFGDRVLCVTGCHGEAVAAALVGVPVRRVHHPGWSAGMGSSIACAMAHLPASATSVLIVACDQVGLEARDFAALAAAGAENTCAAARYGGQLGIPARFPRRLFPALASLTGDRGARAILAAEADLAVLDLPAAAIDVDVPTDLARLGRR